MSNNKQRPIAHLYIFIVGVLIFIVAAYFGYEKLQYGFNFTDEGYHMTAAWRLCAGDHFLKNRLTGAHNLTAVINSLVFKIAPDITLLGFRQLQFAATIFSLLIFSIALFQTEKQFWFLPYIFSLFAFTGLDVMGNFSNLTYYTYPHLFITLSLSFFIFGLHTNKKFVKPLMFIISGILLWGISFSLLNLGVIVFFPIILYFCVRKLKFQSYLFTFQDLCFVIVPFILCWLIFLVIFNTPYIHAVYNSILHLFSKKSIFALEKNSINWAAIKHIGVSVVFLVLFFMATKNLRRIPLVSILVILSIYMYMIIQTSFFGQIDPYFVGIYAKPMWLTSLLTAFFMLFCFNAFKKFIRHQSYSSTEELSILLLIPIIILSVSRSMFSTTGILSVVNFSIPAVAALAYIAIDGHHYKLKSDFLKLLVIIFIFSPFYITTAKADWEFTFFDVAPKDANFTIQDGFGKGIKTNRLYYEVYHWIKKTSDKYTTKNDFMISYAITPMSHMISKRRPSLDKSFFKINSLSAAYFDKAINNMIRLNRQPEIAFVFESPLSILSSPTKKNSYHLTQKEFLFSVSQDPVTAYVKKNMMFVERFKVSEEIDVKCFLDKNNKIFSLN